MLDISNIVIDDDLNPEFMFSTTATALLVAAINGGIDLKELAIKQMENRGLDNNGNWVGFNK